MVLIRFDPTHIMNHIMNHQLINDDLGEGFFGLSESHRKFHEETKRRPAPNNPKGLILEGVAIG